MLRNKLMFLALGLACAGCAWSTESAENPDRFESNRSKRLFNRHSEAHVAQGAANDGMLLSRHFDGDQLNSLGQSKLSSLARSVESSDNRLSLYLYLPEAELTEQKLASVRLFLADQGLDESRLALHAGPNPATDSLASVHSELLYQNSEEKPGPLRAAQMVKKSDGVSRSTSASERD